MALNDFAPDPFADVTFSAPQQGQDPNIIPTDVITSALTEAKTPQNTAYTNSQPINITDAMNRVNEDTSNTGVVAYKDGSGRVTLTNQPIRDAGTGQVVNPQPTSQQSSGKGPQMGQPGAVQSIDTPTGMFAILSKLRAATDVGQATSLYESFQQSLAQQQTKLEQDAVSFAENRIGIPNLERQLSQAEAADRADINWYPGIGDSPITAKIRAELVTARGSALQESKNYLAQNQTYKSLQVTASTAATEFKRIQTTADRKEILDFQNQQRSAEWKDRNAILQQEKAAADKQKLEEQAQGITANQVARMVMLQQSDFVGMDPASIDAKVKTLQILKQNKNKDFVDAVNAEGNQLPVLALKGNKYASSLVMAEEANKTGQTQDDVAAQIKSLQQQMFQPGIVTDTIKKRYQFSPDLVGPAKDAATKSALNSMPDMVDPNKKNEANDFRANILLERAAQSRTAQFISDTRSWKSTDPAITAAAQTAAKTTGNAGLEATLVSYLGDSEGPARVAKALAFKQAMQASANQYKDSYFGMPDYRYMGKMVDNYMANSGFWKTWLNKTVPSPQMFQAGPGATGMELSGMAYNAAQKLLGGNE